MLKRATIAAAAAVLAFSGNSAMATETGTAQLIGAGPNCFKIYIQESGTKYAVDYASTSTSATIGFVSMLVDFSGWTTITIETDGTQPKDCADGTFYRIIGMHF
jgi:hypothetical protein